MGGFAGGSRGPATAANQTAFSGSAWGMVLMQLSMQPWRTIRSKTGPGSRSVNQCLYGVSGNMYQFCFA